MARVDIHPGGELVETHLPLGHHHVQIDDNGHGFPSSNSQIILRLQLRRLAEQRGHDQAEQAARIKMGTNRAL